MRYLPENKEWEDTLILTKIINELSKALTERNVQHECLFLRTPTPRIRFRYITVVSGYFSGFEEMRTLLEIKFELRYNIRAETFSQERILLMRNNSPYNNNNLIPIDRYTPVSELDLESIADTLEIEQMKDLL